MVQVLAVEDLVESIRLGVNSSEATSTFEESPQLTACELGSLSRGGSDSKNCAGLVGGQSVLVVHEGVQDRRDRTFLYRHRDLLADLHTAGSRSAGAPSAPEQAVTQASLQADLANANARAARLSARVRQLEDRLSRRLGNQAWRESGLGTPDDTEELQRTITRLERTNVELDAALDEVRAELAAAREANRDLTRAVNQRG
jgi:hypothetical protein